MISLYLLSSNASAGAQEVSSRLKKLSEKKLNYGSFSDGPEKQFIDNMQNELSDIQIQVLELEKSKLKLEVDLNDEKLINKYMEGIKDAKADLSQRIDDLKEEISNLRFLINKSPYFNSNEHFSDLNNTLLKIYDGIKDPGEINGFSQLNARLLEISYNIENLRKDKIPGDKPADCSDACKAAIINSPYYFGEGNKKYNLTVTFSYAKKIHAYKFYKVTIKYDDEGNDDECKESEDRLNQTYTNCEIIGVADPINYSDVYINGTPDTIIKPPSDGSNEAIFEVAFTSKRTHKVQVGLHGYGDIKPLSYDYNCADGISFHIFEYFLDWLRKHFILGIALIAQLITNIALIYTTFRKVVSKNNKNKAKV
jgi:hypothetical protein